MLIISMVENINKFTGSFLHHEFNLYAGECFWVSPNFYLYDSGIACKKKKKKSVLRTLLSQPVSLAENFHFFFLDGFMVCP